MCPGVDGPVVCDGALGGAVAADLNDLVGLAGVELVDQRVRDIGKDDLVAGVVEEAGHEAAANVAGTEVDGLLGKGSAVRSHDAVGGVGSVRWKQEEEEEIV